MMFDRGRLDALCHFQLFYGEKKNQIGQMIQMDSRDGSDEVLEKPSVEIASYYLAEEKPSREPCRCGTIGKITEILWAVVARSINEQMYKLPTSLY